MFRIQLHPEANKELQEAYNWYEERSTGLGLRFINTIDTAFKTIAAYPDRYPLKENYFREINTKIFPYVIIYEVFEKEKLVFVQYVFHSKRNPEIKYKRRRF